jgi:outer membrane receptor for ferric coprogen and ferric-rhodotorulic acid
MVPGLKLGTAVQYQSRIYRDQGVVANTTTPIVTTQNAYALVDLMIRYDLDAHWSVTGNLRNLTDRKYLTSLMWEQGLFGPPRTAMATLGWRF